MADAVASLSAFSTREEIAGVTVYPIAGYDAGIGLDGKACLNINWRVYLDRPGEFGYMMIHESTHVVYGKSRPLPDLAGPRGPAEWSGLLSRMAQDEGFSLQAPLAVRLERGDMRGHTHPILEDYAVLASAPETERVLDDLREAAAALSGGRGLARDECMGDHLRAGTFAISCGCEILRRAYATGGPEAAAAAFRIPGERFLPEMGGLVGLRRGKNGGREVSR